jgi:hypothetical protein
MERQRDFDRSEPAREAETGLGENAKALDVTLTKEELGELDRTFALGAITGERYPAQVRHLSAK